jgi:ParB/RepB/Spo0J family partition protein
MSKGRLQMKIGETEFKEIDVNLLKEAPYNLPERTTDEEMPWLVKSIAENGILQNLRVVEPEGDDGMYEVVCGNRRAKAAKLAGEKGRIAPCEVISKDTTLAERKRMNLIENLLRKDLSYAQQYIYMAEIMKAFNQNTQLVAASIGWPHSKVTDLLKYGLLPQTLKDSIRSPDDFKNAISTIGLPEKKALDLIELAREKILSSRSVANMVKQMQKDPNYNPRIAAEIKSPTKKRGAKISFVLSGEWNQALEDAAEAADTSKGAYVEEATKNRIADDGFDPRKRNRESELAAKSTRERLAAAEAAVAEQS